MPDKLSFAIHTLGCKVNTYESDTIAESLKALGFEEKKFTDAADIYIVNTCTVTNIADRKSRQMLRRARKLNPDSLIVAAGCYVDSAVKNGALKDLLDGGVIDIAVSNKDKGRLAAIIAERLGPRISVPANAWAGEKRLLSRPDGHTRAFVKVQDGCDMFCSYCVIPYVRGRLTFRDKEDVAEEIRLLAENGVTEAVLTGIHLSSLRFRLLDMIEEIEKIDGIQRIRLGSLEPTLITEGFADRLSEYPKLCPHFHLSLQSGSDEILKKMNRNYTAGRYLESCDILKERFEHPAITADIIVGFPTETDKDFQETCDLVGRAGLYEAHVFKFSARKGTAAYGMEGQIDDEVKSRRSRELISISGRMSHEFRSYYIGRQVEFLSEEPVVRDGVTLAAGYTREYVRCVKETPDFKANTLVKGKALQIIHENDMDEALELI